MIIIWLSLFAGLSKKKRLRINPLGTVVLTDSVYIDKQPIRVSDYLEFLSDIRRSYTPALHDSIAKLPLYNLSPSIAHHLYDSLPMDSAFYDRMLTRSWMVLANDRKVYDVDYHLINSKFYNYPVININYYQIFEYCRWRTDKVKLYYAVKCKSLRQRQKYPINFKYRPVKRLEWEKAITVYFEDIGKSSEDINNLDLNNTASAYIYDSKKQFYYQSTNVAEYLEDDLLAIGFNWNDKYGIGDIKYAYYSKPTDWISFRCSCEILSDTINKPIIKVEKPKKAPKEKKVKTAKPKKKKGIKLEKLKR